MLKEVLVQMINIEKKNNFRLTETTKKSIQNISSVLNYFKKNDATIYSILVTLLVEINELFSNYYYNELTKTDLKEFVNLKVSQTEMLFNQKGTKDIEQLKSLKRSIGNLTHEVISISHKQINDIRGHLTEGVCLSYYADSKKEYKGNEIVDSTFVWDAEFYNDKTYYQYENGGEIAKSVDIYNFNKIINMIECKTKPIKEVSKNEHQLYFLEMMQSEIQNYMIGIEVEINLFILDGYNHLSNELKDTCSHLGIRVITSKNIINQNI